MSGLMNYLKAGLALAVSFAFYYFVFFVPHKLEALKTFIDQKEVKVEREHKIELFELNSSITIDDLKRTGYEKIPDDNGVHTLKLDGVH